MLTLVLGGVASGKSEYTESLVLKTALPRYYLAIMQVWDNVLLEDLSNLAANDIYDPNGAGAHVTSAILHGLDKLATQRESLVAVSNEVFSDGADYADDTNLYLLTLAQVNNALAARANAVVRVVCAASPSITGVFRRRKTVPRRQRAEIKAKNIFSHFGAMVWILLLKFCIISVNNRKI